MSSTLSDVCRIIAGLVQLNGERSQDRRMAQHADHHNGWARAADSTIPRFVRRRS